MSHRSSDLGNVDDPLAETVYILLSKQTQEPVYQRIYRQLARPLPALGRRSSLHRTRISSSCSARAGLYEQRAQHLKDLLAIVETENRARRIGPFARRTRDLTLDFLPEFDDGQAEAFLTSLQGIGPKSARCVLAYSLERSAFAVDTHVHRIFSRLGVVESKGRERGP